jgi:hypothetical protein
MVKSVQKSNKKRVEKTEKSDIICIVKAVQDGFFKDTMENTEA